MPIRRAISGTVRSAIWELDGEVPVPEMRDWMTGADFVRTCARLSGLGRRRAHATYHASHATDAESALNFAMDLTPLIDDPTLPIAAYVLAFVDRFRADVARQLLPDDGDYR